MTTCQQTNLIGRLLIVVSILFLVPVAVAGQTIIGQASGNGTIPSGEYAGQSFAVSIRGEYSGFGFETLIIGEATVVIGTETFVSIVSPDFGTFQSFCCGEGHVSAAEFSVFGQVRHTTAAVPHNHLFAASATSDGQVMCFNIADQSGTVVTPVDPPHDPGIGLICDIPAQVQIGPAVTQVAIDIKPGSYPNSINPNANGVITVAILTTGDFDATTVDHTTVTFEGAGEAHVDKKSGQPRRHEEDVDGDGDTDLVFHFRFGDTDLTSESEEGTITGETWDGVPIEGTDSVRIVPPED